MKEIEVTIQDIWKATRPNIERNKKKYIRTKKHKNKEKDGRE